MKFIGHLFGLTAVAILSLLLTLFAAYVSVDISHLFSIPMLSTFTIAQFFGAFYIVWISRIGLKLDQREDTETQDTKDHVISAVARMIAYAFMLLVSWGMAYLGFWLLF